MATHAETAKRAKVAVPCAAWHITFGGRCLNCGFDPDVYENAENVPCVACGRADLPLHFNRRCGDCGPHES